MSQRKVAGQWVDEGPSSAAATDPISMHANGGMPHLALPHGGAGAVEISRVEVDEVTRSAAREARLAAGGPMYVVSPQDQARAQASRSRGAQSNKARIEASKAPRTAASYQPKPAQSPEEEIVSEPQANIPDPIPEPTMEPPANAEFMAVAAAAREVAYADAALQAADERHDAAMARLGDALTVVGLGYTDFGRPDGDDHVHQVMTIDLHDALAAGVERIEDPDAPDIEGAIDELEAAVITPLPPTQAERDAQSRRNGQTSMQAQRRAVELASAVAAKTKPRSKRSPEAKARMSAAMTASYARRKAATAS